MRAIKIIVLITTFIILFATCIDKKPEKREPLITEEIPKTVTYESYTGSEKCASCHKDIYEQHLKTNHYLTSLPATEKNIKGSFKKGKNIFHYNPDLYIEMKKTDSGLRQVVYYHNEEKISLPFDITMGSGNKGQSFIYWNKNSLFQLPLTYFTDAGRWANSPGFPAKVQYERPITSRCLECHTTFAEVVVPGGMRPDLYDRNKIILGIGCEKCHGPGAAHVAFHEANPLDTAAKFIVNPSSLSRQQNIDICALCHGGRKEKTKPSFSFTPGDTLSHFFADNAVTSFGEADVHGNQLALLQSSKCFKMSGTMTCGTCHDPHVNERGMLKSFSQKCMSCHNTPHKNISGNRLAVKEINNNCIDCHMPAKPSANIVLFMGNKKSIAAKFRTHHIAVYK
ncbi:MAG: hypothetical protein J7497_06200 [Chitinophagaceae bacterium]|nr:hypothetical protein [Chitinophagaceae bacterium]